MWIHVPNNASAVLCAGVRNLVTPKWSPRSQCSAKRGVDKKSLKKREEGSKQKGKSRDCCHFKTWNPSWNFASVHLPKLQQLVLHVAEEDAKWSMNKQSSGHLLLFVASLTRKWLDYIPFYYMAMSQKDWKQTNGRISGPSWWSR